MTKKRNMLSLKLNQVSFSIFVLDKTHDLLSGVPMSSGKWISGKQWILLFQVWCFFSSWFSILFLLFMSKLSLSRRHTSSNAKIWILKKKLKFWVLKIFRPRMRIFVKFTIFCKITPRNVIFCINFDMEPKVVPFGY